jgi:predicted nucleotidyltransferase
LNQAQLWGKLLHVHPDPDTKLLSTLRAALALRAEVLEAYLFGSTARGQAQPHSDLDIAIFVDPAALKRPGFGIPAEVCADLQASLKRPDIDVVLLNQAPPLLYHRVLRDGIRLFARDMAATTRREGYALSRYCDYLPQLRKIESIHRARIADGRFGK